MTINKYKCNVTVDVSIRRMPQTLATAADYIMTIIAMKPVMT